MDTSDWISILALIISLFSGFLVAYYSGWISKKSRDNEIALNI
jgi:hypothetical protein